MVGELLANRYRVLQLLGEGGVGQVWLVKDSTNGQTVALKAISQRLQEGTSPAARGRDKSRLDFIQEFKLMTQLRHPNCCEVLGYGVLADDTPFLTMEYIPGAGLDELGQLDPGTFHRLFAQILLALSYIHARGLVHCDVKAANVRVRPDGVVKVMDYGLMEYAGQSGGPIRGTLAYLAPEVIRRGLVDRRTDLYALGVLAFEMLAGRQPFSGERPGDVLRAHVEAPPPDLADVAPGVDPRLARVVARLLAKDPLDRYPSADAVMADLGYEAPPGIGGSLLTSPMVGRAPEMARLFVHLARITSGKRGAVVWLAGPPGAGKSRLATEFAFNARLENLPLAEVRNPQAARTPYGPLVGVLRALLPAMREHIGLLLDGLAPVLGKLLPELAVLRAPELDAASERARLHAAVAEAILGLSRVRGTVVVIEDMQWADPLTLEVLDTLLRARDEAALLLMLTSQGEPPQAWRDVLTTVPLGPLSTSGLARMVGSMLGSSTPDPRLLAHVEALSGGNPRHVEILLEFLVRGGGLFKRGQGWQLAAELGADQVPVGVEALLASKVSTLTPVARLVATSAAVVGGTFSLDLLQEVAGVDDTTFLDALDPLFQGQILQGTEEGAWCLARGPLDEVLLAGLPAAERRAMHGRVARALRRTAGDVAFGELPLETLAATANHLLAGDDQALAIRAALEAGQRLAALGALEDAARYLEAGRHLADELGVDSSMALAFARTLGEVQLLQGRLEPARAAFREAIPLAEAIGDRFLLGRALLGASAAEQGVEALEASLAIAERAHRVALDARDLAGAARARLLAARAAGASGRPAEALRWLDDAVALARGSADQAVLAEALAEQGYAHITWLPEGLEAGIAASSEALAILTSLGDRRGSLRALSVLGQARLATGDARGARELLQRARGLADEVGDALEAGGVNTLGALASLELGAFLEAQALARRAADEAGRLGSSFLLGSALMAEALACVWLGHLAQATALIGVAFDQAAVGDHHGREVRMRVLQAEALAAMGRHADSMAAAERLQTLMVETGNLEPQGRLCLLWAENLVRAGDPVEAADYVARTLRLAEASQARGLRLRALLLQGRLALHREAWPEATATTTEALSLARELGVRHAEAAALALRGEWALATQEPSADADFSAAAALAQALSVPVLAAVALFGRAAAQPYGDQAAAWAAEARALVEQALEGLSPRDREAALSPVEVRRAYGGNYIAFSLPRAVERSVPSPRLNPRMWGPSG
ncbi:MAG: protein kinase [Candidatus Sericytochromatia bacterium]|nr:protein kinase [Candidatus Sericytochromatia bacterium]